MERSERDTLVADAQAGEQSAWHAIVTTLGPKIKGYALSKGVQDADDLLQEVMLAASRTIGSFEGSWDDFQSWLFTIAYRRIADVYRRNERMPHLVPLEAAAGVGDSVSRPEAQLLVREQLSEALAALDRLSEVEREVVLLRVVAELDSETVGAILNKRPGTIRVIQTRAVAKIKTMLQAA